MQDGYEQDRAQLVANIVQISNIVIMDVNLFALMKFALYDISSVCF